MDILKVRRRFCADQIIYLSYNVINNKKQEDTFVIVLPVYVF